MVTIFLCGRSLEMESHWPIGPFLDGLIVIEDIEVTRPAEVVRGSCPTIQVCELPFAGRASTHATRALMPWRPDACRNTM